MLIVRLDAIGDALVTVPLVAALRTAGYSVSAVLTPRNAQAFSSSALERVHLGHDCVAEIRECRYDVALIPSEETEAYELARDARIPQRIGFHHGWRGGKPLKSWWMRRQLTRGIYRSAGVDTGNRHECEIVFSLAAPLMPHSVISRDPAVLRPLVIDREPARDERIAFQVTDKWIRLGATLDDLAGLAAALREYGDVRFIGAASEAVFIEEFSRAAGWEVETFATLPPWKMAVAASPTLVAPDSGAIHVAGMTGTPVVAAFASENFVYQRKRWSPWAAPFKADTIAGQWVPRTICALDLLRKPDSQDPRPA